MAELANQGAYQGGLAGTEVAIQPDRQAGGQHTSQRRTERFGGVLIRQVPGTTDAVALPVSGNIGGFFAIYRLRHGGFSGMDRTETGQQQDWPRLAEAIKGWAGELGFAACSISAAQVGEAAGRLREWLDQGRHGGMDYMAKHADLRADPAQLVPGAVSVISVRLPYFPGAAAAGQDVVKALLGQAAQAYVSRYALGRDYHKVIRNRLQKLADRIRAELPADVPFDYRAFSDSAPVMEVQLAQQGGLAWRGKHTLSLTRQGSWHFLGELVCTLPLPPDAPQEEHCGSCSACLSHCPTDAIVAPYQVDARRCISYLTIEHEGPIPEELRPLLGNRIYGCDDCQLYCPWNRFTAAGDAEFAPRQGLEAASLLELFAWSEAEFLERLAGSPIRRIGHARWLRNIALALGNLESSNSDAATRMAACNALQQHSEHPDATVREQVAWSLARLQSRP